MKLSGEIKGKKEVLKRLQEFEQVPDLVFQKLELAGNRIRNNAVRSLNTISPGPKETRYSKPAGKRTVTVSRPGDAPNPDTRQALRSIGIESDAVNFTVKVGTNLKYLAALEFDSRTNRRRARPWLRPAFRDFLAKAGSKFFKVKIRRG